MKVGIVGLPNAGKSSLFNALTRAGAEAANYPFTTIEPNVAVVPVRDDRLEQVAATIGASNLVPDTIDFHDIAGLVAGAHKGEGLGNQFLANIRETDALVHVVRCHQDANVIHPEGRVDPAADMEIIETELVFADLEQAERRHARVVREARGGDKAAIAEEAWLRDVIAALQRGEPARTVPVPDAAPNAQRNLSPLTGKPVLYVANVDEGDDAVPSVVADHAAAVGAAAVAVSSRTRRRRSCARSSASGRRASTVWCAARSACSTCSRSSPPARPSPPRAGTCGAGSPPGTRRGRSTRTSSAGSCGRR
jgi:GTP-binding protein YchF